MRRARRRSPCFLFVSIVLAVPFVALAGCGSGSSGPSEDASADAASDGFASDVASEVENDAEARAGDTGQDAPAPGDVVVPPDMGAPDGNRPDGTTPDGTAPDGTASDGGPDGGGFVVLGEPDTHSDQPVAYGLSYPQRVFITGTKLLVADSLQHRVLVWNTLPTAAGTQPDLVLGQPDLGSYAENGGLAAPTGTSMGYPVGIWSDGTRLFVADRANNRILVWNTFPTQTGQTADFALGQPAGAGNLTSGAVNNGGISGASINGAVDVWSDGTRLYVADPGNNRVLVWATIPGSPVAADFALGQPNLTSSGGGTGLGQMQAPQSVHSVGTTLYVSDGQNNRVLVWSALPSSTVAASLAIDGSAWTTPATLKTPAQMAHTGSKFLLTVSGYPDNQLLVWNSNPTAANAAPDLVLSGCGPTSATTLCQPTGVGTDGTRLYVADESENRVLSWNTIPTAAPAPADFAIGQPAGSANLTDAHGSLGVIDGATFDLPSTTCEAAGRLFVADSASNRVLVWNTVPSSNDLPADFALGQPAGATNLTSYGTPNTGIESGSTMFFPAHATSDGTRVFVADEGNNRVLVWNSIPSSPVPADFALGQPAGANNLVTNQPNTGGVGGATMSSPSAIWTDGTRLFVSDYGNNRVLVWNTMPTSPVAADFALGQPAGATNLTTAASGAGADGMSGPQSVYGDGTHVFVADSNNNRVLVWNSMPSSTAPADLVIGQAAFGTNGAGASATALNGPSWAHSDGTRVYVADWGNNRVLVWNAIPTASGAAASSVIGQPDFTSATVNEGRALGPDGLNGPSHVTTDATHLFITDTGNSRTLVR